MKNLFLTFALGSFGFGAASAHAFETVKLVTELSFTRCVTVSGIQDCKLPDVGHPRTVEIVLDRVSDSLEAGFAEFYVDQDGQTYRAVFDIRKSKKDHSYEISTTVYKGNDVQASGMLMLHDIKALKRADYSGTMFTVNDKVSIAPFIFISDNGWGF